MRNTLREALWQAWSAILSRFVIERGHIVLLRILSHSTAREREDSRNVISLGGSRQSPVRPQLMICQLLTATAGLRPTWFMFQEVVSAVAEGQWLDKKVVAGSALMGATWASIFWSLVLGMGSLMPARWRRRLYIPGARVRRMLQAPTIYTLIVNPLFGAMSVVSDIMAVWACAKESTGCDPGLVWKDPKEGVLWAL